MRSSRWLALGLALLCSTLTSAQVLLPEEVQQPGPHRLQLKYLGDLRAIGSQVESHKFPFNFYLSRTLDISEKDQLRADQRSIRFDRFQDLTVLAITGNYFAAYSAELVDKNNRAGQTLEAVVLPILQIAVPHFVNDDTFDGFAIEISQHVRSKAMGVSSEAAENVMYYFPRAAAQHLSTAKNPDGIQAALLESKIYIDAQPFNLWVNGNRPDDQPETYVEEHPKSDAPRIDPAPSESQATVSQRLIKPTPPARIITPKVLDDLKVEYSSHIKGLEHDLRDQAHFAKYVDSGFVGFHEGAYLQLSVIYEPIAPSDASRYKLTAISFDDYISHLVRPTLAHFPDVSDFDGILYSVIVKPEKSESSVGVEFFLPFVAMRCFARYDCTGQELIDSGFVLINGERATVNLVSAEASPAK